MSAHEQAFEVGTVISFSDLSELSMLEEKAYDHVIGLELSQRYKAEDYAWSGRVALRNLVRPSSYNRGLIDIQVTPQSDPFDTLMANIGPKKIGFTKGQGLTPGNWRAENVDTVKERIIGFDFSATTVSMSLKPTGAINTRFWYVPNFTFLNKVMTKTDYAGVAAVRRGVLNATLGTERLVDGQNATEVIGIRDL